MAARAHFFWEKTSSTARDVATSSSPSRSTQRASRLKGAGAGRPGAPPAGFLLAPATPLCRPTTPRKPGPKHSQQASHGSTRSLLLRKHVQHRQGRGHRQLAQPLHAARVQAQGRRCGAPWRAPGRLSPHAGERPTAPRIPEPKRSKRALETGLTSSEKTRPAPPGTSPPAARPAAPRIARPGPRA
ncbi:MAG: hypothetical protein J3K34DRAFT_144622 [Monoraphidium minutum]|nr:MAG: hypothetical protein J3K34DRAFT_144622 [Monoraphidium minutum]